MVCFSLSVDWGFGPDLGVRLGFRSGESKCSGFIGLKGLRVYSSEFRFAHVVFFEGGQCS